MGKRLKDYSAYISAELASAPDKDKLKRLRKDLLIQIGFFSHERLIHLLVTALFALLTLGSVFLVFITESIFSVALTLILLITLGFYVRHYYLLENGVQALYKIYDEINRRLCDE